jgi:hypothetical protein
MHPIRKRIVNDESMRPVAVLIEYADWLEVERLLGLGGSGTSKANGAGASSPDLNRLAGKIDLREDPVEHQRQVRGEWP